MVNIKRKGAIVRKLFEVQGLYDSSLYLQMYHYKIEMSDRFTHLMIGLAILSNSFIYLQAFKVWKRQSHDDLSLLLIIFNIFNASFWAIYGLTIKSLPLIVSGSMASIGFLVLLTLKLTIPSSSKNGWKYI